MGDARHAAAADGSCAFAHGPPLSSKPCRPSAAGAPVAESGRERRRVGRPRETGEGGENLEGRRTATRIYLFGSVARGEPGPDSDYDLLAVVPDEAPQERRGSRLAYQALCGTGIAADVLVCTRSYFEARRHLRAWLPGTVLREGRLLHGV